MPGTRRYPVQPRRCLTFSRDRRTYSNGGGLPGLCFGLLFTSSGSLLIGMFAWSILGQPGIVAPQGSPYQSLQEFLGTAAVILLIGGGHLLGGTVILLTLRSTFDRAAQVVTVRSGWLGLRRQRRQLSEFQNVEIIHCERGRFGLRPPPGESWYDLALRDHQGSLLVVGQVTRSRDLARAVGEEMAAFVHLPFLDESRIECPAGR